MTVSSITFMQIIDYGTPQAQKYNTDSPSPPNNRIPSPEKEKIGMMMITFFATDSCTSS